MVFNWQQTDWPNFRYDATAVEGDLLRFADQAGQVTGLLKGLSETDRTAALVRPELWGQTKPFDISANHAESGLLGSGLNLPRRRPS